MMLRRNTALLPLILMLSLAYGQVPDPEHYFGHQIGAEKRLLRWDRIVEYMRAVAGKSDRMRFAELGRTTNNNPFIMIVISSPDNLRALERYQAVNRKLFDPRTVASEEEARTLAQEGRIFVLVTCSIHATEIGANQMSVEALYRLATGDSPQIRKILDNVVFLLVPSLNPDGQIMVTDWYNKTLGTPNENAPLPWLYHPYVGHDNNRDAYMFTQKETRLIGRVLYQDWLPAVWLDEHQMGPAGPRIFVMPALDPINPNVDPVIYRYTGLLGFSQAAALEKAGKAGIIYGDMYTYWWEGAMAWAGWWHNMYGLLTEVASARIATSIEQQKADPDKPPRDSRDPEERPRNFFGQDGGRPLPPPTDVQSRSNYPRPWLGGSWSLRDIIDYELIATFGLLETAADMRAQLLEGIYTAGKRQIELGKKGNPFAIVVPADQADRPTVVKMLQILALGGLEVHQAQQPFGADGKKYPAGTYVILLSQPFRAYAKDMLEPQIYPRISPAPGVSPRPPYDVAGWSLGKQMGVDTIFVREPFEADLRRLESIELAPGRVSGAGSAYVLSHEPNNSLVAVNRLLKGGFEVSWLLAKATIAGRNYAPGAIVVRGGSGLPAIMESLAKSLGIDALAAEVAPAPALRIHPPHTALYQPWGGNMDEGWTRWLLEQNEFPFVTVHPQDIRSGDLRRFNALIFPDMNQPQIISGLTGSAVPEEYRGGIEESGLRALREFVTEGGTIISLGQSSSLLMDRFAAPFRNTLRGLKREDFFCPGSILRVLVDNTHPIAFGMKAEANADFTNSLALEAIASFSTMKSSIVVRYPSSDILISGWLQGETYLYDKVGVAEVRLGKGRMILIPLRVQQRAQPYGTFKLLFNSILTSAATS
jgi:hypothetical protein